MSRKQPEFDAANSEWTTQPNGAKVRKFAAQKERVDSGAIQFGQDWPGLFLRGDECAATAIALDHILRCMDACLPFLPAGMHGEKLLLSIYSGQLRSLVVTIASEVCMGDALRSLAEYVKQKKGEQHGPGPRDK